jgi:CheY-like chemotaxis protein
MKDKFILLVAEDSETDLLLLKYAVSELSEAVDLQITRDGAAAVSYLIGEGEFGDRARHPLPHLIMLDLKMPGLTGACVLEWLQGRAEFDHIPRIVMSGSSLKTDAEKCYRHGADNYFVKPSTLGELRDLIRQIIGYRSRSLSRQQACCSA